MTLDPRLRCGLRRSVTFWALALAGSGLSMERARGQAPSVRPATEVIIAASEQALWLARIEGSQTTLYRRTAITPLRAAHTLNGRAALLAPLDAEVLVVLDDNSIFRYADAGQQPVRELDLPVRERPLHVLGAGRTIYALVPASIARRLTAAHGSTTAPATQAFDPGESALSVATYDGSRWAGLAPCPVVVPAGGEPTAHAQLCLSQGELLLLWSSAGQIHNVRLDPQAGTWHSAGTIGVPGLSRFWSTTVGGVPVIVARGDALSVYRLLPDGTALHWRRSALELGPLPADAPATGVASAFGFNQHVGVLLRSAEGDGYVQFGRFGAAPTEPTVSLREVFSPPRDVLAFEAPLQIIMLFTVLAVFATLVVVRRGSITKAVALPPGVALALTTQRLVAWMVDFLPFMLVAAGSVGIGWLEGLRHVLGWAMNAESETSLPAAEKLRVVTWWALSVGGYTVYCLLMELVAGRTVGKLLLGVRLLSETGEAPRPLQILIRNASRLLELLPPLWVLGFLALLTRNRQRVGDIFARTVAVRRTSDANRPGPAARGPAPPDDDPR